MYMSTITRIKNTGVWVYRYTKYIDLQVYKMYGCTFV